MSGQRPDLLDVVRAGCMRDWPHKKKQAAVLRKAAACFLIWVTS